MGNNSFHVETEAFVIILFMKELSMFMYFTPSAVDLIEVQPGLVLPMATRTG